MPCRHRRIASGDALSLCLPVRGAGMWLGLLPSSSRLSWRVTRQEPLECHCLSMILLVSVDDGINGVVEQTQRHKHSVQKEDPVFILNVRQDQPELTRRCHHGCNRLPNSTGGLLGGMESEISGFSRAPWCQRSSWPCTHPSLSAGQPGMPATRTMCADMHQPDPLPRTTCPQALKLFVAAWRARTESSVTMPHRETDLFYPRHHSVTALLQYPDITVVIRGGDKKAGREPRCGDRGRTAGSVSEVIASLAERVHPVFLVCCSAYSSAGQLMFSLATVPSNSSSYWGDTGDGASALSQSPSSKDERRSPHPVGM